MLLTSMHTYKVREAEFSYNVKWTILSHVKYMVTTSKILRQLFDDEFTKLREESFIDSLPENTVNYPVFAVDYLGEKTNPGGTLGTYVIAYRGAENTFLPNAVHGQMTLKRKLQLLHDTFLITFASIEEDTSGIILYDFTKQGNVPKDTGVNFKMTFEETSFEVDPTTGRALGGIDWIFSITM